MASYDVQEILDSRKKGKTTEYLVRWAPTWETEKNLNCAKLIKEFKAKSGDNEENGEENESEEEEDESAQNTSKRATPRKAAKAGNKKRKASQKGSAKKTKRRR